MMEFRSMDLPVVDRLGKLVHIVTESELLYADGPDVLIQSLVPHEKQARIVTVDSGTDVSVAAKLLIENDLWTLPVLDNEGNYFGAVTRADLFKSLAIPLVSAQADTFDKAIHIYSCFISYSGKDLDFVEKLYSDLKENNVECWFAPHDMRIGDDIWDTIDRAIRIRDKVLLILSQNSIGSTWVEDEVKKVFAEERENKRLVLFPIRLDEAIVGTDTAWATKIWNTRHIGDFSKWKNHETYTIAFNRLLRDLRPSDDNR